MLLLSVVFMWPMGLEAAPLEAYLRAAYQNNYDAQISRGDVDSARAQLARARAALLPSLAAAASYTRNEYPAIVSLPGPTGAPGETITITPTNQLDASVNLNVPLLDMRAWSRHDAAASGAEAAVAKDEASLNDVLLLVVQAYYDALYNEQVEQSASRSLQAAQDTLQRTQVRLEAGLATLLQLRRAEADVGRAQQAVADAHVALAAARRNLGTLSGLREVPSPANDAGRELPDSQKAAWEQALAHRADVRAARYQMDQALASVHDAAWDYAPSFVGKATEHFTNATAFTGKTAYWTAGVALSWNLFDSGAREAAIHDAQTKHDQAQIRLEQTLQRVRDDVDDAMLRLDAARTKLRAAQQEDASAQEALRLSREELEAGRATALDVTVAVRDEFVADVSLARAVADVAVAAETLRHALGTSLLEAL